MTSKKRLIDANALTQEIETMRERHRGKSTGTIYGGYTAALCAVDGANTVDAVEVVRCKVCRFAYDETEEGWMWCNSWNNSTNTKGYCYLGERKVHEN